eukprot:CAMPEP_0119377456 /NCGR_PEP_ID=MMETSP1334-20130426/45040_1 /TAXON_ID=127549 /ORGANISM="Calcidiscus leptoporus, Strain RCC1130" /LENGTH=208 /DNA_ID=CAMNT_0007396391 /DNA_START=30 /DNA_END=657 /DNA_ORIENTATION=-
MTSRVLHGESSISTIDNMDANCITFCESAMEATKEYVGLFLNTALKMKQRGQQVVEEIDQKIANEVQVTSDLNARLDELRSSVSLFMSEVQDEMHNSGGNEDMAEEGHASADPSAVGDGPAATVSVDEADELTQHIASSEQQQREASNEQGTASRVQRKASSKQQAASSVQRRGNVDHGVHAALDEHAEGACTCAMMGTCAVRLFLRG